MRRPIATINPELGDHTFLATFGRPPAPTDDARDRIATHVGFVARLLRARDASHLSPALQLRRAKVLDALDAYVAAGAFPTGETDHGFLPTFLDPVSGVRCAVAHLVETTAGTAMMQALDRDHHNDYIADFTVDARFVEWAEASGLTVQELTWIQPAYPPPPPAQILYTLAAAGQLAVAHDDPASVARGSTTTESPTTIGMLDATVRYIAKDMNHFIGTPRLGLDGGIGITSGEHTAYDLHAELGTEVRMSHDLYAFDLGIGIDAYGPAIPRAWTVPLDLSYEKINHTGAYGIHGGPRFSLEDARDLGWRAGLTYRRKDVMCDEGPAHPRDLLFSVAVTRLADATFIGLSVGVGNSRRHLWYED